MAKLPNKAIQGTSWQRGFPQFILVAQVKGLLKLVATNPACL